MQGVLTKQSSFELKLSPYVHLLVKPPSHSDGKKCLECEGLLRTPEGGRV